jgi:hypothetical protein
VALGSDGGGGIKWFPWLPLLVVGIGLGITGVVMRKDDPRRSASKTRGTTTRGVPGGASASARGTARRARPATSAPAASAAEAVARILSKAYRWRRQTTADRTTLRTSIRIASQCTRPRRGLRQAYVREGMGGVPLLLVHGWPETKRIYWKVIAPLADAGFDVIVPDLRGFGDSDVATGFHDVPAHSRDLYALVHDHLGLDGVVLLWR